MKSVLDFSKLSSTILKNWANKQRKWISSDWGIIDNNNNKQLINNNAKQQQ